MVEPTSSNWKRRLLIAAAVSLLAYGAMIAASFMPWLVSENGNSVSGWDIYEAQSDPGYALFVPRFFTDASGGYVPFWTGLATLLVGVWLAVWAIIFLAVFGLLRRRFWLSAVAAVLLMLLVTIGMIPVGTQAMFYFEGGPASGASLEYGLILLWIAAIVGIFSPLYGALGLAQDRKSARMVSSPPTPNPS